MIPENIYKKVHCLVILFRYAKGVFGCINRMGVGFKGALQGVHFEKGVDGTLTWIHSGVQKYLVWAFLKTDIRI